MATSRHSRALSWRNSMAKPLGLTDSQYDAVVNACAPLAPADRSRFLVEFRPSCATSARSATARSIRRSGCCCLDFFDRRRSLNSRGTTPRSASRSLKPWSSAFALSKERASEGKTGKARQNGQARPRTPGHTDISYRNVLSVWICPGIRRRSGGRAAETVSPGQPARPWR